MSREANDPTRAGFTPPASGAARLSLSEVEALCLKAARGAGMTWGLAEEAGFAARWLYRRGLDGPGALLARLEAGTQPSRCVRTPEGLLRSDDGGILCPIAAGAALSDFAGAGSAAPVAAPLLVLPFVHLIARAAGATMALTWNEGSVEVAPDGALTGAVAALAAVDAAEIAVSRVEGISGLAIASGGFAPVACQTLARLNGYAMRTTVPASAGSRADAGSGLDDND